MTHRVGVVEGDTQGWEWWRVIELGEKLDCFLQLNAILPTAPWLHLRVVASLITEHTLITKDGANYG